MSEAIVVLTLIKYASATGGLDVAWSTWKAFATADLPMSWTIAATH